MKRKCLSLFTSVLCGLVLVFCFAGCGSSNTDILENDDMVVQGVYVDESYAGSNADKDVKRLYIFSEITASSGTLKVSSAGFTLDVSRDDATDSLNSSDVIQSDTDGGSALANIASSYTCSNIITEVLPGSSAKLVIPFNVPSFYLQEGSTFELSDSHGISDGIKFGFDIVQDAESLESIAQSADSEGYAAAMTAREDASPEVAQDVMNRLNGYEYYSSVGGLTQKYKFAGNRFVASSLGRENPGTYVVKNGYLACTQDATGWVTWIPWEADSSENGIKLDIGNLFVEK